MEGKHRHIIVDGIGATEMMHIFISESVRRSAPASPARAVPGYEATVLDENGRARSPKGTGPASPLKAPTGCRCLDDPRQDGCAFDRLERALSNACRRDADGLFIQYLARSDDVVRAARAAI